MAAGVPLVDQAVELGGCLLGLGLGGFDFGELAFSPGAPEVLAVEPRC